MGCLGHLIDPRFLRPLANSLSSGPHTELDLRSKFLRGVPNRNLSQRSLRTLLDLARQGGLIYFEQGVWRTVARQGIIDQAIIACLDVWQSPGFTEDILFRNRCAVCLDRGLLSATAEYTPLTELSCRSALSPVEWVRLISGPCDLRQLTGCCSKHAEADFLMLYRSSETVPITDDSDVSPRIQKALLTALPSRPAHLLSSIHQARDFWREQVAFFLGAVTLEDFAGFIIYSKDLLDLLLWGTSTPLQSLVAREHMSPVAQMLQRFGLRAECLSTVWRDLPSTYRIISRLSWGVRYLNNNLAHPSPSEADRLAFLKVCCMPLAKQSAISTSRSGRSLLTLIRPLRVLHRALESWRGRAELALTAEECSTAIAADMHDDKLLRREFAERLRRLNVIGSAHILDALTHEVPVPAFPVHVDEILTSAGLIATFSRFFESTQGRAYSEVRLALHAELSFQRRFNIHSLTAPQRYQGIWRNTIQELIMRLEDTRRACSPT